MLNLSPLWERSAPLRPRAGRKRGAAAHGRRELPPYKTHQHTLYGKQEGNCAGCGIHFRFRNLTVDHIVSQSLGGTDHLDNLQLLCGACNSMKGTINQAAFHAKLTMQALR